MDEALNGLREQIAGFSTEPYLLTVTDKDRPHCGTVAPAWDADGRLLVDAPSSWPGSAASGHEQVSLLWPPAEPGGYSLIVDGTAAQAPPSRLSITPTRAVLHRRGPASPDGAGSCGHDCVPLL